jgi:hypothetical protein
VTSYQIPLFILLGGNGLPDNLLNPLCSLLLRSFGGQISSFGLRGQLANSMSRYYRLSTTKRSFCSNTSWDGRSNLPLPDPLLCKGMTKSPRSTYQTASHNSSYFFQSLSITHSSASFTPDNIHPSYIFMSEGGETKLVFPATRSLIVWNH